MREMSVLNNAAVPSSSRLRALAMVFGALMMLAGCAVSGGKGATPEEIVARNAVARWQAIIAGDWKSAYSYGSSAYRTAVSLDSFRGGIAGAAVRKAVELRSVLCEESSCKVVVKMTYQYALRPGFGDLSTEFEESWIEDDGKWVIYQRF